jgi:ABC-type polysaccharide/polyol phosphate export permease
MMTFARQAYFSYKGLFMWLNWPAYVSSIILRPGFMVAIFGLTGRFARGEEAGEAYMIGMTAFAIPHILMGGILQNFAYERSFGTLGLVFASSGSRLLSFLSRGVLHYPNAMMTVVASLFFAGVILSTDFQGAEWGAVAVTYALMGVSCTLFGLFLGNFSIAMRDWQVSFNITQAAFMALTGAIIPRSDLPAGLYELSGLLPVTHGLEGLRAAFAGADIATIRDELMLEALIGVAYAAAGYGLYRLVEAYARRSGAYEMTR